MKVADEHNFQSCIYVCVVCRNEKYEKVIIILKPDIIQYNIYLEFENVKEKIPNYIGRLLPICGKSFEKMIIFDAM